MTPFYIIIGILLVIIVCIGVKYRQMEKKSSRREEELLQKERVTNVVMQGIDAYFLLIDRNFIVQKTNYFSLNGIPEDGAIKRVGDLLKCKNAVEAEHGCGTHEKCKLCGVRATIGNAFYKKKNFHRLEASMRILDKENDQIVPCDVSVSGTYVNTEGSEQMVLTVYDITELKNTQRMLDIEKENAISSEKLKSAFIANMSHEIRTPLNAIVGFSGLLATVTDEEEKQMYLDIVSENNERLLQIVSDILDLSKIESGSPEFKYSDFDVNDLLRGLQGIFEVRMKNTPEVALVCEAGMDEWVIRSEKDRIVQILTNLVHNATKFTPSGKICFGCRLKDERNIYFYVSDTGIGIPAEEQDNIFNRFAKLDREVPGTGLGLTLSQTIVRNLGGDIGVTSEVTKGSTFWFTLPLNPNSMF